MCIRDRTNTPRSRKSSNNKHKGYGGQSDLDAVRIEIPPTANSYSEMYKQQQQQCAFSDDEDGQELFTCGGSETGGEAPTSRLSLDSARGDYAVNIDDLPPRSRQQRGSSPGTSVISGGGARRDSIGGGSRGVRFVEDDSTDTATNNTYVGQQPNSGGDFSGVDGLRRCAHCGSTFRGAVNMCPVAGLSHRQLFDELQYQRRAKREMQRRLRQQNSR
eukprot:TRINITY_DN55022_c0_g1_i7.p1 TRINITY_DN55022_c0_g1~~TRINITY_DN55022_c0_g1_i7.p1  ORF type:complete len:217 (-),score=35.75 TRINITY_DN55022_c0_g1_i7:396-1046(-)